MPADITLKALGLMISPNQLSTPPGALTKAPNVIIRRDNTIESRRGFKLYGTQTATLIKQLFVYKERILRHFGSTLQFDTEVLNADNESIFSSFAGSFNEVQTGLRIKSIESNGNFYFTTSDGIKKISASSANQFSTAAGYVTNAGGVKAINGSARLDLELGNSTGFLPGNSAVAYRFVWGKKDANNNLILGVPSERVVIYNPLLGFIVPDFDRLLGALDDITQNTTTAYIGDGDYVSTLALDENATATDVQSQLITLATKIDTDIFVAGTGANPITIQGGASTAVVATNVATITKDSGGNFDDYFSIGDHIFLSGFSGGATVLNGLQTVAAVDNSTITFNITTADFTQSPIAAGAEIHSGRYRNIIQNVDFNNATFDLTTIPVNNPATGDQLGILQAAIEQIIEGLQSEPGTIIATGNQTTYISVLDITTSANVLLTINIPQDIDSTYFLQIYRSDISTATGTTILSDLTPNDEMQQVYEAFPTAAELLAHQMIVLDVVVDEFAGANLYTNPSTGETILQANDIPPLSTDINRFKNVIFYANTKTRQRLNFNLLGVTNFKAGNIVLVSAGAPATITTDEDHGLTVGQIVYLNGTGQVTLDGLLHKVATVPTSTTFTIAASGGAGSTTGYWSNSMLAIIKDSSVSQYYFIKGVSEIRTVVAGTKAATSEGALNDHYFTIFSGRDQFGYYVWYDKTGTAVDPAIANSFGIKVDITDAAIVTAADVAQKTREVLARFPTDFTISGTGANITITNNLTGNATNTTIVNLGAGWSTTTTQQGRGEDITKNEVLLSTAVSPAQAVDETARSLQNVVNLNSAETVYIYYLSGLADVPGKMLIEGRELSSSNFIVLANNSDVGSSFDPAVVPNPNLTLSNTATNPTVITATAHGLVSGNTTNIAFSNSTPSINGSFLATFLSANTYSIPVNVVTAGSTGVMISSNNAVLSDNEQKGNRVYYSKINQPEAVPLVNFFDVGSQENEILRIFPLRDSLFVFKKNEGLYRISGEVAPFNLALFDSTCTLIAADSIGLLSNQIFCWTDEGLSTVSESGVSNISRDIDTDILRIGSNVFPNFTTATWGTGYHSDSSYTVYTNSDPSDEVATVGYRYSILTNSWTTIDKSENCGLVNTTDDKMYMGAGDVNFIEQERKNFDRTDYADREIATVLNDNNYFLNGEKIILPSIDLIEEGDVLFQEQYVTITNFNALLRKLDLDAAVGSVQITNIPLGLTPTITVKNFQFVPADVNTGTETITVAGHGYTVNQKVRFVSSGTLPAPLVAGTDYFIKNPLTNSFQLSATNGGSTINLTTTGSGTHTVYKYHNLIAGDYVILSQTNSDPIIDGTYLVTAVPTGFSFTIALTQPITTVGTFGLAKLDYLTTQEMVGGQNIRTKLLELAAKLDTDPGTSLNNYASIIGDKSGSITNIAATNPAILTSVNHGLKNGRYISLTGTNSTPTINGNYAVTVIDANNFSVPVSVIISGNAGSFSTQSSNYKDLLACFNAIVNNLNVDSGVIFNNYVLITYTTQLESLITSVNRFTKEITLSPSINFLVGPLIVYRAIETIFEYTPQTMGDALGWKHLTNFTMMFENKAFTEATVSFASDLLPEFLEVPFLGDGNGIFGFVDGFGDGFFGGSSHGAPFRTIFPRPVQRCRYVRIRFRHRVAREKWSVFGSTINGTVGISDRAYRR